jgi:hypothetical protein
MIIPVLRTEINCRSWIKPKEVTVDIQNFYTIYIFKSDKILKYQIITVFAFFRENSI